MENLCKGKCRKRNENEIKLNIFAGAMAMDEKSTNLQRSPICLYKQDQVHLKFLVRKTCMHRPTKAGVPGNLCLWRYQ
jgi:hypothetical protein